MTTQEQVAAAILKLPLRLRQVLVMRRNLHMPRADVAAALHISERRVDRRMAKASAALRRSLDGALICDETTCS